MVQAEHVLHTRRGFTKWLAGIAGATVAVSVPVLAKASAPKADYTVDWQQLESELIAALTPLFRIDREILRREAAFDRWKKKHPLPHGDDPADHSTYNKKYETARKQLRFHEQRRLRAAVSDRCAEVCKRIADTPIKTMDDIRAKSRLCRYENNLGIIRRRLLKELQTI